jgi:hypothetical protein
VISLKGGEDLASTIDKLLKDTSRREALARNAGVYVEGGKQVLEVIHNNITPFLRGSSIGPVS